jgi:hypothetical protein
MSISNLIHLKIWRVGWGSYIVELADTHLFINNTMDAEVYLAQKEMQLLDDNSFKEIILTKEWVAGIPTDAGVYVLKLAGEVVYVGETGNLRGRLTDLLDSRHHSVRRTLGKKLFSTRKGYMPASERKKFPYEIELLLDQYIMQSFSISYIVVQLGRKELEERIERSIRSASKLNKRGKRKNGYQVKDLSS